MPPPPEILTSAQKQFLRALGETPLRNEFYFTGGTALSALHLHHRYSEDLDFFTANPESVRPVWTFLEKIFENLRIQPKEIRRVETFCTFVAQFPDGESFKVDFALDAPFRIAPLQKLEEYGLFADNMLDISANKLSALFDRAAPKDFVDIYFLVKEKISPDELILEARKKHVGMDDYFLAQSFLRVKEVSFLPRMIKPVTLNELRGYFETWAEQLARKLK